MAPKKTTGQVKKVALKLTPEQIAQLEAAFGKEFARRVKSVEVDQIANYLRSNMKFN